MRFSTDDILTICPKQIPIGKALWEDKQTADDHAMMSQADPFVHSAQYQQDPAPAGGGMFKDSYWNYYDILPSDIDIIRIYCDTAQKTAERNDYSVFQAWARSMSTGIYLLDQFRGKWEAPELESNLVEFWNKHKPSRIKPLGASCIKVEDKSSGTGLIQSIKKDYLIPIEGIPRHSDKVVRAHGVVKYLASGYVHLPKNAVWLHDYKEEFRQFTPLMTHPHDDQIDPTMDAIEDLLAFLEMLYNSKNTGG